MQKSTQPNDQNRANRQTFRSGRSTGSKIDNLVAVVLLAMTAATSICSAHTIGTSSDDRLLLIAEDDSKKPPAVAPLKGAIQATGSEAGGQLQGGANSANLQSGTASTDLQAGTASTGLQAGTASTALQAGTASTTLQAGTASGTMSLIANNLFYLYRSDKRIEKK